MKKDEIKTEYNSGKSDFVPGMSFKLSDIILKSVRGIAPAVQQSGEGSEDPDFDDVNPLTVPGFDLVDAQVLRDEIGTLNSKLQKAKVAKALKDESERIDRLAQERFEKMKADAEASGGLNE